MLLEACRMVHQLPHSDGDVPQAANPEIKIVVDVAIEVDVPLLDLLHHGFPCEQLRYRPEPEQGTVR